MTEDKYVNISIILAGAVLGTLSWGYVLAELWGWFVVPMAPALNMFQALGLALTVRLAIVRLPDKKANRTSKENAERAIAWCIIPWLALGLGWIYNALS